MTIKQGAPVEYVTAGSMTIKKKEHLVLKAVLGSCVGLALWDDASELGGLAHFLLPEPVERDSANPGRYASIGVKVFVDLLINQGARLENLKAAVGGGGLVGRLTAMDLNMDLGGRTLDTVKRMLKEEGIPIVYSETGGYLGCNMVFDLSTLTTEIIPVVDMFEKKNVEFQRPDKEQINDAMKRVKPIPQNALKIIRMLNEGDYDWSDIAVEVKRDQVIGARLLHLANAPLGGTVRKVESIDKALALLGEQKMLQLVLSVACQDYFTQGEQGYALTQGGLYKHAIGVAFLAEKIAKTSGACSHDIAYTAGLLHDIGKVILDKFVAQAKPFFYKQTDVYGIDLLDAERDMVGITHTKAGVQYAWRLGLPRNLRDVIAHHHDPENAAVAPELTAVVYLADWLIGRYHTVFELDSARIGKKTDYLKMIGLDPNVLPELIDFIPHIEI